MVARTVRLVWLIHRNARLKPAVPNNGRVIYTSSGTVHMLGRNHGSGSSRVSLAGHLADRRPR